MMQGPRSGSLCSGSVARSGRWDFLGHRHCSFGGSSNSVGQVAKHLQMVENLEKFLVIDVLHYHLNKYG